MKIINEEQIKAIRDIIYQLNAPIQIYINLNKMLDELPESHITNQEIEEKNGKETKDNSSK